MNTKRVLTAVSEATRSTRVFCCGTPFSYNANQLGPLKRILLMFFACLSTISLFVVLQRSFISCSEHESYDPDICKVPLSLIFASPHSYSHNLTRSNTSLNVSSDPPTTTTLATLASETTQAAPTTTTTQATASTITTTRATTRATTTTRTTARPTTPPPTTQRSRPPRPPTPRPATRPSPTPEPPTPAPATASPTPAPYIYTSVYVPIVAPPPTPAPPTQPPSPPPSAPVPPAPPTPPPTTRTPATSGLTRTKVKPTVVRLSTNRRRQVTTPTNATTTSTTTTTTTEPPQTTTKPPRTTSKPRLATTYEGYTLPYYLVAALDIGALVTCVLSGLGLILYVFVHPSKRFPRLNHMRTRVAKIVVSNVLRVMAIVVIPQFALYVPGMYVGRTIGSPYTYALVAMPSMWIILSIALELYQTLSDTKKASMLSGHDFVELGAQGAHLDTEAQGSYEDMDPANPQFQEHLDDNLVAQQLNIAREQVTARIAEGASRSNAGMRIGKFAIMVVIGLTMFIIVCNSDDFLVFQKSTMPYMIGLAVMMLAGAIYTVADFLLENVCQPTGLQRTLPRKRFGALLVMVFLHNLFFAVFLSLALLAFYMPQVREHGLAYKPDIVGPNDVAALHGVSGMFAVAFLSALVGLMQCTIYKYVHGVAWIFVINAGLWGVALAGQRSMIQNVTLGSSIVISAFMWLILNQLHTMMSGMRTISKKFSASYARVNGDGAPVGGGDEDEDAGEADEFPYENDEYQLDNLDPMAAVSSAPAAGSFNVAPQQFDTSNPLNASGLHLTKAQQARQMAIERMASTAIGRGPGRQNGGETSAASDSDGASVRF